MHMHTCNRGFETDPIEVLGFLGETLINLFVHIGDCTILQSCTTQQRTTSTGRLGRSAGNVPKRKKDQKNTDRDCGCGVRRFACLVAAKTHVPRPARAEADHISRVGNHCVEDRRHCVVNDTEAIRVDVARTALFIIIQRSLSKGGARVCDVRYAHVPE